MKNLNEVLDIAKEKYGSDYRVAKTLNVGRAAVSQWRKKGSLDNTNAAKLADITGVNFSKIVAMSESAKHPDKREFWGKMIAASVIMALCGTGIFYTESTAYGYNLTDEVYIMRSYG